MFDVMDEIVPETINAKIWPDYIMEDHEDALKLQLYLIGGRSKNVDLIK
jgi:hypothetical protein